ncbi:nuclease-related domain-containing protein [Mesoflavibacter zeaxanthinifaciens]|uniref:nuclease-related domain-containing protein n=1 Tax=Mesoflavibacter zeaxanthinifaciens TaxID=393060 RepID=UPI003A957B69
MAIIYGTIESLKSLKSKLLEKGITRFNSVGDIKTFISNYKQEKESILVDIVFNLEKEYIETCKNLKVKINNKSELKNFATEKFNIKINDLEKKIAFYENNRSVDLIVKVFSALNLFFLKKKYYRHISNKTKIINSHVEEINRKIKKNELFIKEYETDKQNLIEKRAEPKLRELNYTRKVIENSKNLISGAIGESLVVKEVKKLTNDYTLINDFKLNFSNPIFYKKYNQLIYSIQIDHLLISKAGIFIIETKNWSKSSVNSISLRSPVEQIERTNFALYIYLSENITLNRHHWGEQQIPIRNLIVMINHKPKANFKYVKVKLLKEMNDYIRYFEPVLTEDQLKKIKDNLIKEYS